MLTGTTRLTIHRPFFTSIRHVLFALSDALDLVGIDDIAHGKRVGIMAAACAKQRGDSAAQIEALFDLGLLHDIGVSSTVTHGHLVQEFDWNDSQNHCDIGYRRLRDYAPLAWMAQPVKYHHTRWDDMPLERIGRPVADQANLIFLVDRIDGMAAPHYLDGSLLMHAESIRQSIARYAGSYFSNELVATFLAASESEAFWLSLEPHVVQAYLTEMLVRGDSCTLALPELRQLAQLFSRIVDAKSPFTAEHSLGVAALAKYLAAKMGVATENCDKLEISGLLHDIGKLRVPDGILDKPGKLDERERKVMNAHSFETYQILRHIPGFEEIAPWAAYHHEEPDGNGYPFHLKAKTLPLEARILRVADIFQAMVQDRPYRNGLSLDQVGAFMKDLSKQGRIEAEVFLVLEENIAEARRIARPSDEAMTS